MNAKAAAAALLLNEKAWQEMVHAVQFTRDPESTAHRRGGFSPRDSAVFLAREILGQQGIHANDTAIRIAMRGMRA